MWVVDAVAWLVLTRMPARIHDPVMRAFWQNELYSFCSYNQVQPSSPVLPQFFPYLPHNRELDQAVLSTPQTTQPKLIDF